MVEDFVLSDKIRFDETGNIGLFMEKDVKEFIRRLKEEWIKWLSDENEYRFDVMIDKLAGSKLT